MPKAGTIRKVTALRGVPVDATVKFKTSNRSRNRAGRATTSGIETALELLPPEPPPTPLPVPQDLYPGDPESESEESEEEITVSTQKGRSKAVSVSPHVSLPVSTPAESPVDEVGRVVALEGGRHRRLVLLGGAWRQSSDLRSLPGSCTLPLRRLLRRGLSMSTVPLGVALQAPPPSCQGTLYFYRNAELLTPFSL